jgi:hypothetical protein
MPHGYHVLSTSVSSEMHSTKYGQHVETNGHHMFDHQQAGSCSNYSYHSTDSAGFVHALGIAAQTQINNSLDTLQYGTTDDFFNPLTSSVLDAQQAFSFARTNASPVDMSVEPCGKLTLGSRTRYRKDGVSVPTPARNVKQSPVVKPQTCRRKESLTIYQLIRSAQSLASRIKPRCSLPLCYP